MRTSWARAPSSQSEIIKVGSICAWVGLAGFFCYIWKSGRISATLLRSWFLLSSLSLSFLISNGYCLQALNVFSKSLLKEKREALNDVMTQRCMRNMPGNEGITST